MAKHKEFTNEMIELLIAQEGRCFFCGFPMPLRTKKPDLMISKDHFIPKSKGGQEKGNTVLCHVACNQAKGNQDPTKKQVLEFVALRKRLHKNRAAMAGVFDEYKRIGRDCLIKG